MPKNIVETYEDKDTLIGKINKEIFRFEGLKFFEGAELDCPLVVDDELAKKWLEINYMFSTSFMPNKRPGIGEIGADIMNVKEIDGQDYMVVRLALLDYVIRALNDFRAVEDVYAEWVDKEKQYREKVSELQKTIGELSAKHPQLEQFKEAFKEINGHIGLQYVGLPSKKIIDELTDLEKTLIKLNEDPKVDEAKQIAENLKKEFAKYHAAIPELKKIREYHKHAPFVARDGFIRISTPPASGGLSIHTHPAYDDAYASILSCGDLMLLGAQSRTVPGIVHIGGGETQGEHYIMHVPKKIFFEEVKKRVDESGVTTATEVMKIKQEVLNQRIDDIMAGEIIGMKYDGKTGGRILIVNPLVAAREYEKHKKYFESRNLAGKPFEVKDIILDFGDAFALYTQELRDAIAEKIGTLTK